VPRALDWEAVRHLFTFLVTPPAQSIVQGVKKLEPARLAIARDGSSLRTQRYWDVEFQTAGSDASEGELVEQLRGLLDEAVALHQVSDVPVGAFLSGGVDSSAVVATMSRLNTRPVKTFSVGFPDADFSELEPARQVASLLGTEHHELVLEPDVVPLVEDFAWFLDEPFGDTSAIATYMVSKLAAGHVKVVLTGDGGDEIFAGYDRYFGFRWIRLYAALPAAVRRNLLGPALYSLRDTAGYKTLAQKVRWMHDLSFHEGGRRYAQATAFFRFGQEGKGGLYTPDMAERYRKTAEPVKQRTVRAVTSMNLFDAIVPTSW